MCATTKDGWVPIGKIPTTQDLLLCEGEGEGRGEREGQEQNTKDVEKEKDNLKYIVYYLEFTHKK